MVKDFTGRRPILEAAIAHSPCGMSGAAQVWPVTASSVALAVAFCVAGALPAGAQQAATTNASGQQAIPAPADAGAATPPKTQKKKSAKASSANQAAGASQSGNAAAARAALGLPPDFKLSDADVDRILAMNEGVSRLNKYSIKGLNIPYPGFEDSVLQDYGGWRSALAEQGFGVVANITSIGAFNTLAVPRNGPGPILDTGLPSNQQYWGQQPSGLAIGTAYLTYDTSRWGVPDGQILVAGVGSISSWEPYTANYLGLGGLSWYQTLFDKKLEIKIGYVSNAVEWIGAFIGGNLASPLGVSASIPYEMGLSAAPMSQPTARVTWHINEVIYNQAGIMRSLPIGGPTSSPLYDNAIFNPTGFDFNVPNGGMLLMDEVGLKIPALPGVYGTWIRGGVMYNDSTFFNFQNGGTNTGIGAGYILGDLQVLQFDPSSIFTSYRGMYIGASGMWGSESNLPFSEYYEARVYFLGPFASRPKDQLSFVYNYNGISKYARDYVNQYSPYTNIFANTTSQSYVMTYTAHMAPGVYATLGLSYTENPSFTYTKNEGSSLNLLGSLFLNL
ncbi:carbohydrate porin [Xanthobacter wiegelii]|uniref:carbohydrate porin n=1 Tax=Xanthobacter wiegelii TaxID=3119913 RepID=UPI003726F039